MIKPTTTVKNLSINTFDPLKNQNGSVITVWSEAVALPQPKQVYVTTLLPAKVKGPHLHYQKNSLFCCIKGNIKVVTRDIDGRYWSDLSGEHHNYVAIYIPAGTPAMLINLSSIETALVLNLPSESYNPTDEHEVDFSDYWRMEGR